MGILSVSCAATCNVAIVNNKMNNVFFMMLLGIKILHILFREGVPMYLKVPVCQN